MTTGSVLKRAPQSKALYSIHDQLDDLRLKELELERAKVELYNKAEEHRYKVELDGKQREFEKALDFIKGQYEE